MEFSESEVSILFQFKMITCNEIGKCHCIIYELVIQSMSKSVLQSYLKEQCPPHAMIMRMSVSVI